MQALLDTHALLWWLSGDPRLSARARTVIADEGNAILVSAASAWEIATKVRSGKLPGAETLAAEFTVQMAAQNFAGLPITLDHAQRAGSLPGPLRDPFDRMLIAQSQAENLPVVGLDKAFDDYRVARLW